MKEKDAKQVAIYILEAIKKAKLERAKCYHEEVMDDNNNNTLSAAIENSNLVFEAKLLLREAESLTESIEKLKK